MKTFLCYIFVLFIATKSTELYSQVPAGDRILGMHITAADNEDYPASFEIA